VVLIGLAGRMRDRAEVFSRAKADCEDRRTPTERTVRPHADEKTPTAEQVAGISAVGEACAALKRHNGAERIPETDLLVSG
jgi:hypothetical protein